MWWTRTLYQDFKWSFVPVLSLPRPLVWVTKPVCWVSRLPSFVGRLYYLSFSTTSYKFIFQYPPSCVFAIIDLRAREWSWSLQPAFVVKAVTRVPFLWSVASRDRCTILCAWFRCILSLQVGGFVLTMAASSPVRQPTRIPAEGEGMAKQVINFYTSTNSCFPLQE